jgi:hypothetical protein
MKKIMIFLSTVLAGLQGTATGTEHADWIYLDNGVYRLGVIRHYGAGIGYLSRSGSTRNLLNHYDNGRLIQQSYYGDRDGSRWVDKPWRLNPVQGGSYTGATPELLEVKAGKSTLYSRSVPRHWATGKSLVDFSLEQWIELRPECVHVRFKMSYKGSVSHAPRHQEIPAVFLDASLSELVLYQGKAPWTGEALSRHRPGPRNEYFDLPEGWAAFIDKSGVGVGVYVPSAERITSYRFRGGAGSDCSYLAPIATFALQPGLVFAYDAYFCIGKPEEIRAQFNRLKNTGETGQKGPVDRVKAGDSAGPD